MAREKSLGPPWQPGQSGNSAGRPIGNRNKLNEKFILALHDDFVEHGAKVIEQVRKDKPDIYLKVIASILPRELHVKDGSMFDGMSNEQLDEILGSVRAVLTARAPSGLGDGTAAAGGPDKLN
jgi:hypothetical protein